MGFIQRQPATRQTPIPNKKQPIKGVISYGNYREKIKILQIPKPAEFILLDSQ